MSIVADLETEFRRRVSDRVADYLYTHDDFLANLREAETEACRRGLILTDATTTAVCNYTVSVDQAWVTLDARVLKVRRADLWTPNEDDPTIIRKDRLPRELQQDLPDDWPERTGDAECIVTDVERGKLRLVPIPTKAATLKLEIIRLPLVPLTTAPEIPARYHLQLLPWCLYRCYSTDDSQLYRPKFAADALTEFEGSFGGPVSANDDLWIGNRGNFRRRHTRFF
jgi:hypothetical protein